MLQHCSVVGYLIFSARSAILFIKYMLRWRLARLVRLRRERDGYERSLQDLYSEKIELLRILQQHKENQPGFFTYVFEGVKVVTGLD